MSRAPAATADQVRAWFDLSEYAPERLRCLGVAEWADLLSHRLNLRGMLYDGRKDEALRYFQKGRMVMPALRPYVPAEMRAPGATASVRLITLGEMYQLGHSGHLQLAGDLSEPYDFSQGKDGPEWVQGNRPVHVVVNLAATKTQLVSDFETWLDGIYHRLERPKARDYATKIQSWANNKCLPYFDLMLYAEAYGLRMPRALAEEFLELGRDLGRDEDVLSRWKRASQALEIFTPETVAALELQARRACAAEDRHDE